MSDLSKFSDTCVYCYKGISDGISVCFCNNSLCDDHKDMHMSKFGCDIYYSLSFLNGNVKVKSKENIEDLERRINIKVKNGMIKSSGVCECPHIYDSSNVSCSFEIKSMKCQECELSENLWVCMECGHVGCGRKQEGIKGNGHALSHFEATRDINANNSHPNAILASSISDGKGDTFCYICEEFVQNPLKLKVSVKNDEIKAFNDLSTTTQTSVKSDILGIVNEGLNCYISSVLHLLNESFRCCDLSEHFAICDSNPSACLACQLIKVLNEMRTVKNEIRAVRITGLLECIYEQMGCFNAEDQEDCSEFLQKLLERLECFEECMLLPKITDRFDYQIMTADSCQTRAAHSINTCHPESDRDGTVNLEGKILYAPFAKSIEESLKLQIESSKTTCKPGNEAHSRCYFSKLSDFLILSIGRYRHEDHECTKIEDPINTSTFELNNGVNSITFEIVGCICHKGSEMVSGHYTWWVKHNGNVYTANDSVISMSDEKYAQNGSLFLLKALKHQK